MPKHNYVNLYYNITVKLHTNFAFKITLVPYFVSTRPENVISASLYGLQLLILV